MGLNESSVDLYEVEQRGRIAANEAHARASDAAVSAHKSAERANEAIIARQSEAVALDQEQRQWFERSRVAFEHEAERLVLIRREVEAMELIALRLTELAAKS